VTFDDEEDDDFASGAQDSATDFSAQSRPRRSLDFSDLVPKGPAAAPARSSKALDFSDLVPKVPPGNVPVPQARPPIEALLAGPRARPADAPPPTPLEPDTAIDRVMRGDDPADVLYGQQPAQAPAPDRTAPMEGGFPAPQGLDEAPFRSGGSVIDKLYGADSGMLSGNEAYGQQQGRLSQSEQAVVAAQKRRDEAKQAYDEAVATTKLSGTPFDAGVQRGAAQRTRVSGAKIALDNAEKELAAAKIAPLPTQTGTRDTMERAPGAAVDQATQTVRAAARIGMAPIEAANEALTSAMGTVRPALDPIAQADKGLDDATRAITDTFSRQLFSKDEAQNERLGSKVVQGVVSTGMFAATGAAGRLAGFSPMWTTAIAGALPQAEGQFQQARSAQEINPTYAKEWMKQYGLDVSDKTANALVKWSMFATGLGIGATEAVPVAHLFERLEKASGGGFTRWVGIMAAQAGEEGLQEGVQQLLENAAVKGLLDPNRSIGKDVADNAMVGAISGALVSGVMAGPAVLAGRGAHPGMPAPAEPAPTDLTGATPPPGAPGATPPPPVAAPAASPHQEDLTPPAGAQEATPPTTEPPQAGEQTSPVSAIERRTLRKMGYADEMIDGMNRAEAEAELGTAVEQGIEPGAEEAAEPANVPEAAEGEKPESARE
jgi:hypothetical protein